MAVSTGGPPQVAEPTQASMLATFASMPKELIGRGKRAVRTAPGRMVAMLSVTVVLLLVAGIVSAAMVQQKQATLNRLINSSEPVASSTHHVFRALADADATTITSFLNGGQAPGALQARYQSDIQEASKGLAVAATADSGANAGELREITVNLPLYTGLIEQAYANQRQGYPIGTSYLHEAYELMTNHLLQPASRLFASDAAEVQAEQRAASGFPWWSVAFLVLLLIALGYTQVYLRKHTNRLFNAGLAIASIAVVLSLLWGAATLVIAAVHNGNARDQGTEPAITLQKVELLAITARAAETLTLVNRNPGANYEGSFQDLKADVIGKDGNGGGLAKLREMSSGTAMADTANTITADARRWMIDTHDQIHQLTDKGQIDQAVRLAVSDSPDNAGGQFNKLDKELLVAIDKSRTTFATETSAASNSLVGLEVGILLLTLVGVIGSIVGISKRLQEYR